MRVSGAAWSAVILMPLIVMPSRRGYNTSQTLNMNPNPEQGHNPEQEFQTLNRNCKP
jgi:hypothetical protein